MAEKTSYHMTPAEFRRRGREVVDWIADYMETVEELPVLSRVAPGEIRAHLRGSLIDADHAEDTSHMCFGQPVRLGGMFATHPPIDERIRAIDPHYVVKRRAREAAAPPAAAAKPIPAAAAAAGAAGFAPGGLETSAAAVAGSAGTVAPEQMDYAERLHAALPAALREQRAALLGEAAGEEPGDA